MEDIHGAWWLAGQGDHKVPGVLSRAENGSLELRLSGSLSNVISPAFGLAPGVHRIFGSAESTEAITLERCFAIHAAGLPGPPRETWYVPEALAGNTWITECEWPICGASFDVPLLTRWVEKTSIRSEFEESRSSAASFHVTLDSLPLWTMEAAKVSLARNVRTVSTKEASLEIDAPFTLKVAADRQLTKDWLVRRVLRPVQLLLGLATGRFTGPQSAMLQMKTGGSADPPHSFRWLQQWHPVAETQLRPLFAFEYGDVIARGDTCLDEWLERLDKLHPVVDLYLGLLQSGGFGELRFLMIAQALETYHRRLHTSLLVPTERWSVARENIKRAVKAAFPEPEYGAAAAILVSKLQYWNEVNLRSRLNDLFRSIGDWATAVCRGDQKVFVDRVVATRNYYTHWSDDLAHKKFGSDELFYATLRLVALLELLLLQDLGFDPGSAQAQAIIGRLLQRVGDH